jgi:hypothetical protein
MTAASAKDSVRAELKRGTEEVETENVSDNPEEKPKKVAKKRKAPNSTLPNGVLLTTSIVHS